LNFFQEDHVTLKTGVMTLTIKINQTNGAFFFLVSIFFLLTNSKVTV